jgi:hypothetical protein
MIWMKIKLLLASANSIARPVLYRSGGSGTESEYTWMMDLAGVYCILNI